MTNEEKVMNSKLELRSQNAVKRRAYTTLRPIAAAVWGVLLATSGAYAQQAPDVDEANKKTTEKLDTIVVTGIRQSIESSIAKKKNSDSIVETISAEDIGKLPDTSIAESLARLPGLTAQRVDGRAQVISIRGLSGNYAGSLLNGRSVVSTGDNRSVEFDQFPSELLSGVTIYKTPDATLIGQGLSGTVDLHTVRPLDYKTRQIVINTRGEINSNGKLTDGASDKGGRFSTSYIDQFANNTVGIALGYAHLDSPGQEQAFKLWGWNDGGITGVPKGVITPYGFEAPVTSSKQKRDGLMAVIEFKPNKDLRSVVDLYYSKFDQQRTMRGLFSPLASWSGTTYSSAVGSIVDGNNLLSQGTATNLKPVVRNDFNTRDDKIFAGGWNTKLKMGEWLGTADLSYSQSKRKEQILETYAGNPTPGALDININLDGISQMRPSLNYADASRVVLSDPQGWGHDGLVKYPKIKDEIKSMRLSGKRTLGSFVSSVEIGGDYSERTKDVKKDEFELFLKNNRAPITVPASLLLSPTSFGYAGIPGTLSYNANGALNSLYDLSVTALNQKPGRFYDIKEKVTTAYLQFGIDSQAGSVPIRGNFGVQAVRTTQNSNGFVWDGKEALSYNAGTNYTDFLPSMNLVFEIGGDRYVRFGAARTLARPQIEDMRAGFTASVSNDSRQWSASGGNPKLKPWRADAYDLSFEQYFGKRSYVAIAGFYKDLKTFIYNKDTPFDFTGFPNTSPNIPVSSIGNYNQPVNGNGGQVDGVELSASLEGGLISSSLDGFGVIGSFSKTHSNLHEDNDVTKPLDGLSGNVATVTLYYEKGGFSARIAERYRSKFQSKTRGVFLDNIISAIDSEKITDLQLGYAFGTGTLKGLSLLLQVNNLTNTPYKTRKGIESSTPNPDATVPERYNTYGRTVLLGVNYKF
jgi:iron complex outermembrane recepter protein